MSHTTLISQLLAKPPPPLYRAKRAARKPTRPAAEEPATPIAAFLVGEAEEEEELPVPDAPPLPVAVGLEPEPPDPEPEPELEPPVACAGVPVAV